MSITQVSGMLNEGMSNAYVAFNGDKFVEEEIRRLIKKYKIKSIIETGTYLGDTTARFAELAEEVHTIEIKQEFFAQAQVNLKGYDNVKMYLGNSPEILNTILPSVKPPVLFYLDAHWSRYWPILDELKAIARFEHGKNSVIVIDDFYVPGEDFGYDEYYPNFGLLSYLAKRVINKITETVLRKRVFKRQRLDYPYIEKHTLQINAEFKHFFNKQAGGARRGKIYIHP